MLRNAFDFIADHNLTAAERIVDDLYARTEMLKTHPLTGRAIGAGLRELVLDDYVVRYRVYTAEVRIVRLYHGRQDRSER